MSTARPFMVDVADLVHRPGARRADRREGPTSAMQVAETLVAQGATLVVDVRFEPVGSGVLATGWAEVEWGSECRRCAKPISGTTHSTFQEEFDEAAPVDGDTYPMRNDQLDLELVAREAILLDLPLAPLCRADCAGLCPICGADQNDRSCGCAPDTADPRWEALQSLSFGGSNAAETAAETAAGNTAEPAGSERSFGDSVEEG